MTPRLRTRKPNVPARSTASRTARASSAPDSERKKPGRRPKGGPRVNLRLTQAVYDVYADLGDGNLTLGIERGAEIIEKASEWE